MKKKEGLKAVDFFCCSGGVTCGFKKAGIDVLAGIDIEKAYKKTYEENNPGSKFINADISNLQPEDLEKELKIVPNMDNLVFVGCSPCQYYTTIQTDKSKSVKGKLLLEEFKRFVVYFKPAYIFIENVPGIETKSGSPLLLFKDLLASLGYFFDDEIINSVEYNVPQNRKRYVLVASRISQEIKVPKGNKKNIKTVRSAIGKLPTITAGFRDKTKTKHWAAKLHPINLKRLQNTPKNGGTRLHWKDNQELQLECYKGKDSTFSDVYGRLFWDLPSPTITTKFFSISNGRFGHPEQDRALSLREGATLQSFPKSYVFYSDSFAITARMIGNAVPPELSKRIGAAIKKNYENASIQSKSKSN